MTDDLDETHIYGPRAGNAEEGCYKTPRGIKICDRPFATMAEAWVVNKLLSALVPRLGVSSTLLGVVKLALGVIEDMRSPGSAMTVDQRGQLLASLLTAVVSHETAVLTPVLAALLEKLLTMPPLVHELGELLTYMEGRSHLGASSASSL